MNLIRIAVVLTVLLNLTSCLPKLTIIKGTLVGQIKTSRDGRSYYSYTSIPYAKAPLGKFRFMPPQPLRPWKGILNATIPARMCVQPNMTYSARATKSLTAMKSLGSEDCLYLNVYYPVIESDELLPVMVWIHGGAFTTGHGNTAYYGPDYFMDKDVVLVSINYRLGVLGFLSTEDDVIPGNYGMKDQVEALRWVRDNIVYFNGDPEQVTIFGQSSGGASVGFHLLSHMSKGLFHKAIIQSGAPLCKWAITAPGVARERAFKVAKVAGCHIVDTSENILNCLRKLPAAYLIDIHPKLSMMFTLTVALFTPVVETCDDCDDTSNDGAFLCHHPLFRFKQENFVPVIIGMNPAEGGIIVSSIYNNTGLLHEEFKLFFNHLMAIAADYNCYTRPKYFDEIGNKLMERYFPDGGADKYNAVQMFTDAIFGHCVMDMALKVASPVYFYLYDYQNSFSLNTVYGWKGDPLGVTHGDELNSLFKLNTANPLGLNKKDTEVSKLMVNIWYRFVVSNKPTIDGTEKGNPWKPLVTFKSSILKINSSKPEIIKNPLTDMLMFWKKLPIGPPYMKRNIEKF